MKKITFFAIAVLLSAVSFAQKDVSAIPAHLLDSRVVSTGITKPERSVKPTGASTIGGPRRAKSDFVIIEEQPDGDQKNFIRSGYYLYVEDSHLYAGLQSGRVSVVFGENNSVYIKDPLMGFQNSTWVKGTYDQENSKVIVPVPQNLYYSSDYDACIAMIPINNYEDVDSETTEITYSVTQKEDGAMVLSLDGFTNYNRTLGAYWTDDGMLSVYGEYNTVFTERALEEIVAPEDLATEEYSVVARNYANNADVSVSVSVGFDGNDVYIQGLCTYIPNAWIKGTLDGTTITFPTGQYFGNIYGIDMFLNTIFEQDVIFDYDANTGTLTAQTEVFLIDNGQYYYLSYRNAILTVTVEEVPEELVTLPEDVVAETWTLEGTFTTNMGNTSVQRVTEVAFDGTDIYVKGLSYYFEDAWLKGTIDEEGVATFANGQFVGEDEYGKEYMIGYDNNNVICDIQFAYDAKAKKLTQVTPYIGDCGSKTELAALYGYWINVVYCEVESIVATPANPTFQAFKISETVGYSIIKASIPTVGTDGETLNPEKLFYTVWIEKDGQKQPYVFKADLYYYDFEEDVVEVPYDYSGYDINKGAENIYLEDELEELASWTNVGIQSIYYNDAGERRESEIQWAYVLDENEGYAATYGESPFQTVNVKYSLKAGWNTIVLPFAVEDLSAFGEGAKAYELTDVEDGVLSVNTVAELKANTPYIIYATEAKASLSFDITRFEEPTSLSVEKNGVTFQGTYTPIAAPGMEGKYGVTGEGSILKGSDKASIKGFRAYFEAAPGAQIKAISFDSEDATGISLTPALSEGEGAVYNLAGQRIQKAQNRRSTYVKGVNIVNGKKVLY